MKYFICALDKVQMGIPAERTARVISTGRSQTVPRETENGDVFISLPLLFGLKETFAPHGIILKTEGAGKTALLTPPIDIDLEIPEESVCQLPDALSPLTAFFTGVYFSGEEAVLILNPGSLVEYVMRLQ